MNTALQDALLALLFAFNAGCESAYAQPSPDPKRDYAPAPGSAPAPAPEPEPKAESERKPSAPSFSGSFPETASEPPTKAEWAAAPAATEARITAPDCAAKRVREWYRISCSRSSWIELVGGRRDGVTYGCAKSHPDSVACDDVWVVFPARRGDRRAFETFSWTKWGPDPDSIVTEYFLEGDAYPSISAQGIRQVF